MPCSSQLHTTYNITVGLLQEQPYTGFLHNAELICTYALILHIAKQHFVTTSQLCQEEEEGEAQEIARLFQKLPIALMRGNAALLNNRMPMQQDEGEFG